MRSLYPTVHCLCSEARETRSALTGADLAGTVTSRAGQAGPLHDAAGRVLEAQSVSERTGHRH